MEFLLRGAFSASDVNSIPNEKPKSIRDPGRTREAVFFIA